MKTITIDGKVYRLIPMESPQDGEAISDVRAKARRYKSNYTDYKNIPEDELVNRIIRIDNLSEWDYCKEQINKWTDWEALYDAVCTQKINPYNSLNHFINVGMELVREAFDRKRSVSTGYFTVTYVPPYTNEDGTIENAEINLDVTIYGSSHVLDREDRDYLNPEDDQTYNNPG